MLTTQTKGSCSLSIPSAAEEFASKLIKAKEVWDQCYRSHILLYTQFIKQLVHRLWLFFLSILLIVNQKNLWHFYHYHLHQILIRPAGPDIEFSLPKDVVNQFSHDFKSSPLVTSGFYFKNLNHYLNSVLCMYLGHLCKNKKRRDTKHYWWFLFKLKHPYFSLYNKNP